MRREADWFWDESTKTPETSPKYDRAITPARSPAVELMREEIKKENWPFKYKNWYMNHVSQAALRDVVMEGIRNALHGRFPGIDLKKLNVHELMAVLSEYLKSISEKLITQNLELPPLSPNHPVYSIAYQKRLSIKCIIQEYKQQYDNAQKKLKGIKANVLKLNNCKETQWRKVTRARYRQAIENLNVEKRMERIVAKRGLCELGCPYVSYKNEYYRLNKPLEEEVDETRRQIVEMDAECMAAMADMVQFADVISPNFLKNFVNYLRKVFPSYPDYNYNIPSEAYEAAAKDVAKHLRRIFKEKRREWVEANKEINTLSPQIIERRTEIEELRDEIEKYQKEILKLKSEFKKYVSHTKNMEWMIKDFRGQLEFREQSYASAYQALQREKRKTAELETQLGMTPRGPQEISPEQEPSGTPSPVITHPHSPNLIDSPPAEDIGSPVHASSPSFRSSPTRHEATLEPMTPDSLGRERPPSAMLGSSGPSQSSAGSETMVEADSLDEERPPSAMLNFSGLQGGESFLDSLEGDASLSKKTVSVPSPGKGEPLNIDIEIIPKDVRRSPSGRHVVCDVAVQMQEAAFKRPRWIEKRYNVVRGTPPISQTVGRRVDRRYGMFTPQSALRRQHLGVRRPLFEGDFESPESPWGTGRRTHPELMNLPQRPSSPRPPRLDRTMEWEDPRMNV